VYHGARLSPLLDQAQDPTFAAHYDLSAASEILAGASTAALASALGIDEPIAPRFVAPSPVLLGRSPRGTWSVPSVIEGGAPVHASVGLDALTVAYHRVGYNVDSVDIVAVYHDPQRAMTVAEVIASQPPTPGQTLFDIAIDPTRGPRCKREVSLAAFTRTRQYAIPVEIVPASTRTINWNVCAAGPECAIDSCCDAARSDGDPVFGACRECTTSCSTCSGVMFPPTPGQPNPACSCTEPGQRCYTGAGDAISCERYGNQCEEIVHGGAQPTYGCPAR
jgi:hypothetical protein